MNQNIMDRVVLILDQPSYSQTLLINMGSGGLKASSQAERGGGHFSMGHSNSEVAGLDKEKSTMLG
jgi:hypothetical protein